VLICITDGRGQQLKNFISDLVFTDNHCMNWGP